MLAVFSSGGGCKVPPIRALPSLLVPSGPLVTFLVAEEVRVRVQPGALLALSYLRFRHFREQMRTYLE
jgi:hypothetical protein